MRISKKHQKVSIFLQSVGQYLTLERCCVVSLDVSFLISLSQQTTRPNHTRMSSTPCSPLNNENRLTAGEHRQPAFDPHFRDNSPSGTVNLQTQEVTRCVAYINNQPR